MLVLWDLAGAISITAFRVWKNNTGKGGGLRIFLKGGVNILCELCNLKYKDPSNFYQFLLLLSGDVSLNPGPVQISPALSVNIWEPLNKKGLHFLHININSLLPKINELKCIANKT